MITIIVSTHCIHLNTVHTSFTTTTIASLIDRTSENLRQLAEQSLQCLDSTRTLNREEQLQERLRVRAGGASTGGPARPSTGDDFVVPPTGDVATIDSDTALWAFVDETDIDDDMGD